MEEHSVKIPRGLDAQCVAETFNAYLLGFRALSNASHQLGPYSQGDSDRGFWQLEDHNDFWMHYRYETDEVQFTWRYPNGRARIEAAIALFNATYHRT